ncbi:hypothetical protein BZJ19_11615 [Salinivibrio proteolyticus]|uniref:hypothetical protein n=1 Tax=Salinivibrio proteolyticus TaxID=334715 RepID=UPI000988C52C|nr:hypothetical protein [Salinivibrio proteolyticus]OOF24019.1 hypothetical protein BZJ19_11615 [Salinivibrio proteolyticus]
MKLLTVSYKTLETFMQQVNELEADEVCVQIVSELPQRLHLTATVTQFLNVLGYYVKQNSHVTAQHLIFTKNQ